MSDFKKGQWCRIWDSLYWRFMHRHRKVFEANPRSALLAAHLKRMTKATLTKNEKVALDFLAQLGLH